MKRSTRLLGVLGLSVGAFLAGCGSDSPDPSSSTQGGAALEARLHADTGVIWLVDRDDAGFAKLLTALAPPPPLSVAIPRAQAAVAFLQRYADLLGARDLGAELVLVEDRADRLVPGAHHLRFAQRILRVRRPGMRRRARVRRTRDQNVVDQTPLAVFTQKSCAYATSAPS